MNLAFAIILGVIGGVIGAVPFFIIRQRIKAKLAKDGVAGIALGMIAVVSSFMIMIIEMIIFANFAKEFAVHFSISAIVVFLLIVSVFTVVLMRK